MIHHKPAIAAERAQRLRAEGLDAESYPVVGPSAFRAISSNPPDAVLIDLTELPSYGRIMGALLRERKSTRAIPLVFLKGDPEKAARVRELLPDAAFATWPNAAPSILRAIERAPREPALPQANVALAKKLRIDENAVVALLQAPPDIKTILADLPRGVRLQKRIGDAPLILLFVKSAAALSRALPAIAAEMKRGRTLWICWPKRTSAEPCDLTLVRIREMVGHYDMVDSKLCAMDKTWSTAAVTLKRRR